MDYVVEVFYSSGQGFSCLFNNHLFAEINGYAGSLQRFYCNAFFIRGKNSVSFDMKIIDENQPPPAPGIKIAIRRHTVFGDVGTLLFEKEFTPSDGIINRDKKTITYSIVFENPITQDFSDILYGTPVCNDTRESFLANYQAMQTFSRDVYRYFQSDNISKIMELSERRIRDDVLSGAKNERELSEEYRSVLVAVQEEKLGYAISSPDQYIFLPTCGGRLWRVAVMKEEDSARKIMDDVWSLPHALPSFDYELIQSASDGGLSQLLPSYIALMNGKFAIVR
jgi:hypothetical protein